MTSFDKLPETSIKRTLRKRHTSPSEESLPHLKTRWATRPSGVSPHSQRGGRYTPFEGGVAGSVLSLVRLGRHR